MTSTLRSKLPKETVRQYGSVYYPLEYWQAKLDGIKPTAKPYGMDQFQVDDFERNIRLCKGGAKVVSKSGHAIDNPAYVPQTHDNRHEQSKTKSVNVEKLADTGLPPDVSVKPSPTPTDVQSNGEGLVSSSQPEHDENVFTAHLNPNTETSEIQLRPVTLLLPPVTATRQAMEPQQESTPAPGEPAQPTRIIDHVLPRKYRTMRYFSVLRHKPLVRNIKVRIPRKASKKALRPILETIQVDLRAMLDAFGKGNKEEAFEALQFAFDDMERLTDGSTKERMKAWAVIEVELVKSEIILPANESPMRRPLPVTVSKRTDPADVIARALGGKCDSGEAA